MKKVLRTFLSWLVFEHIAKKWATFSLNIPHFCLSIVARRRNLISPHYFQFLFFLQLSNIKMKARGMRYWNICFQMRLAWNVRPHPFIFLWKNRPAGIHQPGTTTQLRVIPSFPLSWGNLETKLYLFGDFALSDIISLSEWWTSGMRP